MAGLFDEDRMRNLLARRISEDVTAVIRRNSYRINRSLADAAATAVTSGKVGATRGVLALAEGIRMEMADDSELLKIHERVARQMRGAVRQRFGSQFRRGPGQYRTGQGRTTGGFLGRYSGGALKRAIYADSLAVGTKEGISYVDEGRLTREAAHWARMNFGAKGSGFSGRQRTKYRVLFDERVVATLGFNVDSRPAFSMPPGRWITPEGTPVGPNTGRRGMDKFFPGAATRKSFRETVSRDSQGNLQVSRKPQRTGADRTRGFTRGIKNREFLDAGLRVMATRLPEEYEQMVEGWYADARKRIKLPKRVVVRPGSGPAFSLTY